MTEKPLTCAHCKALSEVKDPNQIGVSLYICRRHPPTPTVVGMSQNGPQVMALFPQIGKDMSACMEIIRNELDDTDRILDS